MTDFGRSSSKRVRDQVFLAVGSAGWLGLAPVAPGTFGALFGVLIHVGVVYSLPESFHITGLILAFFLVCMGTIAVSPWAEEYWQCKDPGHFVLDEVAGYLFVPLLFQGGNLWSTVVWGFCLFRVIDIIKFPLHGHIGYHG